MSASRACRRGQAGRLVEQRDHDRQPEQAARPPVGGAVLAQDSAQPSHDLSILLIFIAQLSILVARSKRSAGTRRACYAGAMMMPTDRSGRYPRARRRGAGALRLDAKGGNVRARRRRQHGGRFRRVLRWPTRSSGCRWCRRNCCPGSSPSRAPTCSIPRLRSRPNPGANCGWRSYAAFVASGIAGLIGNTTMLWFASVFRPGAGRQGNGDRRQLRAQFFAVAFRGVQARTTEDGRQRTEERPIA